MLFLHQHVISKVLLAENLAYLNTLCSVSILKKNLMKLDK